MIEASGRIGGVAMAVIAVMAVPAAAVDVAPRNVTPDTAAVVPVAGTLVAPALRATDLERSLRFYTAGLGMVTARRAEMGSTTEVILTFGGADRRPALVLLHDNAPGKSSPIVPSNGYVRTILKLPDLAAVAARLTGAGYPTGKVRPSSVGPRVLMVRDPDGYAYELVESPAPQVPA